MHSNVNEIVSRGFDADGRTREDAVGAVPSSPMGERSCLVDERLILLDDFHGLDAESADGFHQRRELNILGPVLNQADVVPVLLAVLGYPILRHALGFPDRPERFAQGIKLSLGCRGTSRSRAGRLRHVPSFSAAQRALSAFERVYFNRMHAKGGNCTWANPSTGEVVC